jgi:hypothetical protein
MYRRDIQIYQLLFLYTALAWHQSVIQSYIFISIKRQSAWTSINFCETNDLKSTTKNFITINILHG